MNYYDSQQSGLGDEFLEEVVSVTDRILEMPLSWQSLSPNTRRCLLHRFPYALIYTLEEQEIVIVAVVHLHRKPEHWRGRL